MSKTRNKFSLEVRARAVRMVLENEGDYSSRWAAITSISNKIGCVDLSRFSAAPGSHLSSLFFESQGAFPT
jgi:transposase-like protein